MSENMNKKKAGDTHPPPEPPRSLETLSERVFYLLELRQMSRQGLEEEARLSRGYVSRIVKGERLKLSPELLRRIADALRVSYEWLATGRGDMHDLSGVSVSPPAAPLSTRRPKTFTLEAAIAYHESRWSPQAVAAARVLAAAPDTDELDPPGWADVLDQIEAALAKVKIKKRA